MKVIFDKQNVHTVSNDRVHYTEDVKPGHEPYSEEEIEKLVSDYLKEDYKVEFIKKDEMYPVRLYSLKLRQSERKDIFSNFNKYFN